MSRIIIPQGMVFNPITGLEYQPRLKRPSFKYYDAYTVQVEATEANPAVFYIGGQYRWNTTTKYAGFKTVGVGGIDTGAVAVSTIYYLYAIKGVFPEAEYIISEQNPLTGPTGYDEWTYMGAFATNASALVVPFSSVGGTFRFGSYPGSGFDVNVTETSVASKTFVCPEHAKSLYLMASWVTSNTLGTSAYVGSVTGSYWTVYKSTSVTETQEDRGGPFDIAVVTKKTLYCYLSAASSSCNIEMWGWTEDPTEYP